MPRLHACHVNNNNNTLYSRIAQNALLFSRIPPRELTAFTWGPLTWSARIVIVFAAAPLGNYTVGVAIVFVNEVFATENAVRTAAIPNQPTRLRNLLYLVPVMIQ